MNLNDYIPVNERIIRFWKENPNGRIVTEIIEHDRESGFVLFKASVFCDANDAAPSATGHAFEIKGQGGQANRTSHIENCESSAVGRALAILGYEVSKAIASREEMRKVSGKQQTRQAVTKQMDNAGIDDSVRLAELHKEINTLCNLLADAGDVDSKNKRLVWDAANLAAYIKVQFKDDSRTLENLTFDETQVLIEFLRGQTEPPS